MTAQLLTDPARVATAAEQWDELPAATGPVGGSAWVRAWLQTYADQYELAAVVAHQAGRPAAALPLVRPRRRPWFLEMLGIRELMEPTDARFTDPAALQAIADELARRRLPLRLKRLPAESPLLPALQAAFARRAVVMSRLGRGTPTITLDETWRTPESNFSSRRRQDFRAARRRADKMGRVEFAVEEPTTPAVAERLFDQFVAVEAAGWKTRVGTSLATQPRQRECFRRFSSLAVHERLVRFAVMRIDGRAVAMQLGAEFRGQYCLFKIGFDEDFGRCSPGTLLMLHTVSWAAGRGLRSLELLGVEEPWTALWSTSVRPCIEVQVYPLSVWSVPAVAAMAAELSPRVVRPVATRLRSRWAPG